MIKKFFSLQHPFLFLRFSNARLILNLELKPIDRFEEYYRNALYRNAGESLFLTPLLEQGKLQEARQESLVLPFVENVLSYAGFFTVDKQFNSNMYFWYFPAEESPETAPVVLWLQGGPGQSSLYGLFVEHGPYMKAKDGSIQKRDIYWSKTMHIIYLDNPIGTGYSFTDSEEGYSRNEESVGNNLYIALQQFYTLFPELRKNAFYISGESYAGKYIPSLGHIIHHKNLESGNKINLKGLAIGNGLCDPMNQWDYGPYLYSIGLIDKWQSEIFQEQQNYIFEAIANGDLLNAFISYKKLLGSGDSLFYNYTGYNYIYNYLVSDNVPFDTRFVSFLDKISTRNALHIGSLPYHMISRDAYVNLIEDFSKSVASWLTELANHYKILLYNGGLDIVLGFSLTENFVSNLKWCGTNDLATAERKQWRVDGQLAGYIKTSAPSHCNGSIRLVMVRNSGHTVPEDQPLWAYNLISNFTKTDN